MDKNHSHYFSPFGLRFQRRPNRSGEPEASIGPPEIASALNAPLCGMKHLIFKRLRSFPFYMKASDSGKIQTKIKSSDVSPRTFMVVKAHKQIQILTERTKK